MGCLDCLVMLCPRLWRTSVLLRLATAAAASRSTAATASLTTRTLRSTTPSLACSRWPTPVPTPTGPSSSSPPSPPLARRPPRRLWQGPLRHGGCHHHREHKDHCHQARPACRDRLFWRALPR